jgi:acyl transferase domain-containing protein
MHRRRGLRSQGIQRQPYRCLYRCFHLRLRDRLGKLLDTIEGHVSTGTHTALIPNRISYFLNLHGPSLPIDTACSSSLVALHKAAHAIRRGECDHALVGGVSVLCSPTHFISFSKTGMLSPDGSCKSFDERANGYVRGEGAAMVLIKPLDKRSAMGSHRRRIAWLRRESRWSRPHRDLSGLASAVERDCRALREADVPVSTVGYVEAHGTGTPKGDPIEVEGLKLAFARVAEERGETGRDNSCGIGSVKTNIGHLESVAGMAGLIKTILCMRHQAFSRRWCITSNSIRASRSTVVRSTSSTGAALAGPQRCWREPFRVAPASARSVSAA